MAGRESARGSGRSSGSFARGPSAACPTVSFWTVSSRGKAMTRRRRSKS